MMMRFMMFIGFALPATSSLAEEGAGIPSRDPQVDVLRGFASPPPGYGEVPFWWWTGGNLDPDRMVAQLKEKSVVVKIAENTRVEILRSAIQQVLPEESGGKA